MTTEEKLLLKKELVEIALRELEERINFARMAMENAQESANESEKSSAGDKYETSRAMGQIDQAINSRQLEEAKKDYAALEKIDVSSLHSVVKEGSVIITTAERFFISTGLGVLKLKETPYFFISLSSPLGKTFLNSKVNDVVAFNGRKYQITDLF